MILPEPDFPYSRLNIKGDSITIDVSGKVLVIPTGNQNVLPSFNEYVLNPNRCNLTETPCGGLKNSIVQDKFPGSLSIEGDGCYLQNSAGTYTGKVIGAGKLSETSSIKDSGTTGIAFATADGIEFRPGDGIPFLLSPPSCIVEDFQVLNISNEPVTYTITIQCPDSVDSIELYNISLGRNEIVNFIPDSSSFTFSKVLSSNSSEKLQLTIKYTSLINTQTFTGDANQTIGLDNMTESWVGLLDLQNKEIDFFHFTERPKQLSFKQESDGTISELTLYPGNGQIYHGKITHSNPLRVTGSGTKTDCLNKDIEGSVTKFLKAHGMRTAFPSDATLTTWVVPAISDTKILPLSTISDDLLGENISIRTCHGEYTCASFVVRSNKDINIEIETSDLVCGENLIPNDEIDIKVVKCWWQYGHLIDVHSDIGSRFVTPELLLNDDGLVQSTSDTWGDATVSNPSGSNYLKLIGGEYIDISTPTKVPTPSNIKDSDTLKPINLPPNYNKQIWITSHVPETATPGTYTGSIHLKNNGHIIKTLNIIFTVLPFELLSPSIEYSCYYRAKLTTNQNTISTRVKTVTQFTADMKNLLVHGISNPSLYAEYPYTDLDVMLSIRDSLGLENSHIFAPSSINSDISYVNTIKTIANAHNITSVYIYGIDETDMSGRRSQIIAVHDIQVKVYCAQPPTQAKNIADLLDVAVVSGNPDKALAELYHGYTSFDGEKHKIYSYNNPQTVPEYPRIFRLNYGLKLWQNDYDGAMDFAYQFEGSDNETGNVWNDFDNINYRDHCFAYPTINGFINTVQFEGYREASNDIKYLTALQNSIVDAKTRGVATKDIDLWLSTLKSTDLANVNLDEIRSQIIDYILQLQNSENFRAFLTTDRNPYCFGNGQQLFMRY